MSTSFKFEKNVSLLSHKYVGFYKRHWFANEAEFPPVKKLIFMTLLPFFSKSRKIHYFSHFIFLLTFISFCKQKHHSSDLKPEVEFLNGIFSRGFRA